MSQVGASVGKVEFGAGTYGGVLTTSKARAWTLDGVVSPR